MKSYSCEIQYVSTGFAVVTAKNKKEAIELLKNGEFDDILDSEDHLETIEVLENTLEEIEDFE
jgi:hypothetical protein